MIALTVRQPWGWAIFHGKNVDNRSGWKYKHTGELAIHAGLRFADQDAWAEVHRLSPDELDYFGKPGEPTECAFGAVIGVVDLDEPHWWEDCRQDDGSLCSPWAWRDRWHLPLRRPRRLQRPIECPGRQGPWVLPRSVEIDVRLALR